jgi:hypothetical protein
MDQRQSYSITHTTLFWAPCSLLGRRCVDFLLICVSSSVCSPLCSCEDNQRTVHHLKCFRKFWFCREKVRIFIFTCWELRCNTWNFSISCTILFSVVPEAPNFWLCTLHRPFRTTTHFLCDFRELLQRRYNDLISILSTRVSVYLNFSTLSVAMSVVALILRDGS